MMWIPDKAAFRAGRLENYLLSTPWAVDYWNSSNIGLYSFAFGFNCQASAESSIAMGNHSWATGVNSVAIGQSSRALGEGCVAIGTGTSNPSSTASGTFAVAIGGSNTQATGNSSTAMGSNAVASGLSSSAFGNHVSATGINSTAVGNTCFVTAHYSGVYGQTATVEGYTNNFAFGNYINSKASPLSGSSGAFTIGSGLATGGTLINDMNNTLMIGCHSPIPSVILTGGNLSEVAKVGINTKSPCALFSVKGNAIVGSTWAGDGSKAPVSGCSLVVEDKVGIGTPSPDCNLSVNGTACIGWNGTQAVPTPIGSGSGSASHPVSLIVENTMIIHGTNISGTLVPAYVSSSGNYGASNGGSYLQVWGEAIKFTANSTWDIPSDIRYKKDIHPFEDGLKLLKQVKPVRFKYNEKLGERNPDEEGIGVIAQDIQKILPYTVHEQGLVTSVRTKEEKRYQVDDQDTLVIKVIDNLQTDSSQINGHSHKEYSYKDSVIYKPTKRWIIEPAEYENVTAPLLTYNSSAVTYVLINSVKELDSLRALDKEELTDKINRQDVTIESLNTKIETLNNRINSQNLSIDLLISKFDSLVIANKNLEDRVARLETKNQISLDDISDVVLEQNNPNPFSETSKITYYIPDRVMGDVELIVTLVNNQSAVLQRLSCTKGIPTQTIISAQNLDTGVYVYSLIGNGKVLATKKFIIIK